ncbi:hypothetical protein [Dryocola sp. BD586]|uniref:hypothetical protein n=1 Tax=Dryocola sp. BD586 TaxID=3133271 RepID=UPI003F4F5505
MIHEELARHTLKRINSLSLSPDIGEKYYFKDTIKSSLVEDIGLCEVHLLLDKTITIEMNCDDYKQALFADFHFGKNRIDEQIKNVNFLLKSNAQPAWVLISVYYACFFMANEISKLFCNYIINFDKNEYSSLLNSAKETISNDIKNDDNNSFRIRVNEADYENKVKLTLRRCEPKPHYEVWKNLNNIIGELVVPEILNHYKMLLRNICGHHKSAWKLPSTIRNEWNYKYSNYYGEKGYELAKTFLTLIKNHDSAMKWAGNRALKAHEENNVASIAYLYHCLLKTIELIARKVCLKD